MRSGSRNRPRPLARLLSNLSRLAPSAFVSDAIHRANITVDEDGTEAAAVTGIAVATSAIEPEVSIRADHPFAFAITHPSGVPLFVGQVANPAS
ncbi:MAG: hypothetical protein GEU86_21645 [Actinophytocola sp.]|nr:hypothetical protein [Actinophytocola sp.]